MAPQIDTAQQRAIELLERMGLRGKFATDPFMSDILEHDKQTRRDALEEAVDYLKDVADLAGHPKARQALVVVADALDRLREGVE